MMIKVELEHELVRGERTVYLDVRATVEVEGGRAVDGGDGDHVIRCANCACAITLTPTERVALAAAVAERAEEMADDVARASWEP